jgi:hypothetical protein
MYIRSRLNSLVHKSLLLAAGSVSFLGGSSRASIITYAPPTLVGSQVTYPSVSESSDTSTSALYGAPTVSGNDLVFSNLNFAAVSTNASPSLDYVDGQINFTLQADPGSFLQSLDLTEMGDYNVSATPLNPAAVNYAQVYENAVQITVLAINGVPLSTPLVNNTSDVMNITPDNGQYTTNLVPSTGSWSGSADVNLATLFASGQITEIAVSFDNQLLAESETGGIADIAKKGFDIVPITTNVPEPTVVCLVVAGFGFASLRRRRRMAR